MPSAALATLIAVDAAEERASAAKAFASSIKEVVRRDAYTPRPLPSERFADLVRRFLFSDSVWHPKKKNPLATTPQPVFFSSAIG